MTPARSSGRRRRRSAPGRPLRAITPRGQETRQKLIRAAEKVFGNEGFYAARVSEITREAGVAAGTFYLYFDSKEALLRALIRSINHDLRRTLREGTEHLPSRVAQEERGLEIFLYDFLKRHRKLYRIIRQTEFADPHIFEWYYRRLGDGYARRLRAAMAQGELERWDAALAACALMGIADFVAMRYVTWGKGISRKQLRELCGFIRAGLTAPRSNVEGLLPDEPVPRANGPETPSQGATPPSRERSAETTLQG